MSPAASEEWRKHWPLVLAALAGMSFHSLPTYSMGLFIEPLADEFGWGRAQISLGLSMAVLLMVPLSPLMGAAIDRWGSRKLALPGFITVIALISCFSLANGSLWQWYALWMTYAVAALAIKAAVWTTAVSSVFYESRGLALAIGLSGTAFAQTFAPVVSQWLIAEYGWRGAYVGLALGWGLPVYLLLWLCLFDAHDVRRRAAKANAAAPSNAPKSAPAITMPMGGLSFSEALRSPILIRIAISTLITLTLGVGITVHQVPILTENGIAREHAAMLAGIIGVSGMAGKLATGWLQDRLPVDWFSPITLALPAIAYFMMLQPMNLTLAIVAMIIVGFSTGAKLQICAYLTGRYAGMRNFGKIFGVMSSIIALGSGMGPLLAGLMYDLSGSYATVLWIGIPGSLISAVLIWGLGRYPDWSTDAAPAPTDASPSAASSQTAS
jgi:predicted MFS family arabinose efflux permease